MEPSIDKVKERAQKAVGGAAGRATERAKSAVGLVAHETHALADALRGAAEQAERRGSRVIHEPLRKMADFCEQLAGRADEQDPRQLVTGLTDLGRREPLMLFGAAAAVAVLSRRAMRAGTATEQTGATPSDASTSPVASPPADREVVTTASTVGGMSEAQAQTSYETGEQ